MVAARCASFATAQLSSRGGRHDNQDRAGFASAAHGSCWVVADGLGGHPAGDVAASLAVSEILAGFQSATSITAAAVAAWVEAANCAIFAAQEADPALAFMRTTVVVAAADSECLWWCHVGDSRLYALSLYAVEPLTKDHSVPQALVDAGRMAVSEIRFHEDRGRLLRALGSRRGTPAQAQGPMPLAGIDALLLCTDGFWEYCTEQEIAGLYSHAPAPEHWLASLERRLVDASPATRDNYTAVAVYVRHGAAGAE